MSYRSSLLVSTAEPQIASGSETTAENLVLGRGKLYFTPYAPGTFTGGTKGYFGNTPTLTMTQQVTKLDHYSSEGGLKIKDRSIILQTDVMLAFETDNIDVGNILLWFGGDTANESTLPPDAPTNLGTLSVIGTASMVYGAMFFESDNPVGTNQNYWFPYVALSPTGNYALKGDAWQTLGFQAEALKRDQNTQRVYIYTPTSGSTAAADTTTPYLTAAAASVATSSGALATVSAPGTGVHGTPLNITATINDTNTGDTYFLNFGEIGQALQTAGHALVAGANTVPFTPTVAGNYVATISTDAAGADVIATSTPITVS
jgi:hypothetical protein